MLLRSFVLAAPETELVVHPIIENPVRVKPADSSFKVTEPPKFSDCVDEVEVPFGPGR